MWEDEEDDPLGTARAIWAAVLIGAPAWLLLLVLVWAFC